MLKKIGKRKPDENHEVSKSVDAVKTKEAAEVFDTAEAIKAYYERKFASEVGLKKEPPNAPKRLKHTKEEIAQQKALELQHALIEGVDILKAQAARKTEVLEKKIAGRKTKQKLRG